MDSPPRTSSSAFTLVELLVVMGVIALLLGFLLPAFKSIGSANRLTGDGNRVVNLINLARQDATSKNALAALVLITDPASVNRNRMFTLLELVTPADGSIPATANWRQTTGWEVLQPGVVVYNCTFDDHVAKPPTPDFPALQYGGTAIADYQYAIFLPSGVLLDGNTLQIGLAEGAFPPGAAITAPTYTHPAAGGTSPASYYNVSILNATGRVKIDRN